MKIIQAGKTWTKRINCKRCTAIFEIEESDIQYEVTSLDASRQQYEDDITGTYYVDCPNCEQTKVLKDLPRPMANRIKENK